MKRSFGILFTVTVSTMVMGTIGFQTQSAQAAILAGSQIDFVGRADAEATGVDFQELIQGQPITNQVVYAIGASGDFAPIGGNLFSRVGFIQDTLVPSSPIPNWLTFGTLTPNTSDNFIFSLSSIIADVSGGRYNLTGIFQDGTAGIGQITTQTIGSETTSFSGTLKAVPTPALLPGLIGMGMAAIRKRKQAATIPV